MSRHSSEAMQGAIRYSLNILSVTCGGLDVPVIYGNDEGKESGPTIRIVPSNCELKVLEHVAAIPITKSRHHFPHWREPEYGHDLAAAGITWDTTLGYAAVARFRLGVSTPIPLFRPAQQRLLGIEEHPLTVMDCILGNSKRRFSWPTASSIRADYSIARPARPGRGNGSGRP